MKIECHILQNFPPNCLNRDDTNSPKDCEFGGVRRARISSQCFKRAVRDSFLEHEAFPAALRAVRTKRVVDEVVERLTEKKLDAEAARTAVTRLLLEVDLKTEKQTDGTDKSQYLLFLPERKLTELAAIAQEHWAALSAAEEARPEADATADNKSKEPDAAKTKGKKGKSPKGENVVELPKEIRSRVEKLLRDAKETPEIALFGRMIANNPDWNVEAACQVAQALSTHRVSMEFDFFTAVDDLKKDAQSGSDMMGTVQFNSACMYRYAVVDCDALAKNLGGDDRGELSKKTVAAFLHAFVHARPSGKQNSMAAHTPPSLVFITVRDGGQPISLANAFVEPVRARDEGLEKLSAQALANHFAKVRRMYPRGLKAAHAASLEDVHWHDAAVTHSASVDDLVDTVCGYLDAEPGT